MWRQTDEQTNERTNRRTEGHHHRVNHRFWGVTDDDDDSISMPNSFRAVARTSFHTKRPSVTAKSAYHDNSPTHG